MAFLFSRSVVSDSLQPHGLQHARLPRPSPAPRACSNSCPLSRWCHPTISSSVVPFSSCPQSFPASGSFLMSQLFTAGGQSIGTSASTSVLPMNIQGWFPLGLTGLISLKAKGLSRVFSNTDVQKHQFFGVHPSLWSNSHIHTRLLEKTHRFDCTDLCRQCLCFLICCLGLSNFKKTISRKIKNKQTNKRCAAGEKNQRSGDLLNKHRASKIIWSFKAKPKTL